MYSSQIDLWGFNGLTVIANVLFDALALGALDGGLVGLALERGASVIGAVAVHGALESIALPAEQVVAVDTVARVVSHGPVEGLGAVLGPIRKVVELASVEHDLIHDLRDLNRVRRRACAAHLERACRVGDVRLVVWRVQVLAVPAAILCISIMPVCRASVVDETGSLRLTWGT